MNVDLLLLTYNRTGVAIRCFKSLIPYLNQYDLRFHILDNASNDSISEWVLRLSKKYPKQIKTHLSAVNLGVAGGRDYLLNSLSSTDIVGFLDSDVEIFPNSNWLDLLLAQVVKKNIGIVGQAGTKLSRDWKRFPYNPKYEGPCDLLSGYCQFFRYKDMKKQHIKLDMELNYGGAEDDDWCLQWKEKGYTNYMIGSLPLRHVYSGTWTTSLYDHHKEMLKAKWQSKGII